MQVYKVLTYLNNSNNCKNPLFSVLHNMLRHTLQFTHDLDVAIAQLFLSWNRNQTESD